MKEPSNTVEDDCPHCGKIFCPKRNLKNHVQLHGIRGFFCDHCGVPAKREGLKEWHTGSVHGNHEYYRGRRMSLVWERFLERGGPKAAQRSPFHSPKDSTDSKDAAEDRDEVFKEGFDVEIKIISDGLNKDEGSDDEVPEDRDEENLYRRPMDTVEVVCQHCGEELLDKVKLQQHMKCHHCLLVERMPALQCGSNLSCIGNSEDQGLEVHEGCKTCGETLVQSWNILNQILGVHEVGESLDKIGVPEITVEVVLIEELHDGGTEEDIMKDYMSKRLVPEERDDENIHAKDGHDFFCVVCGQMFKLERNLDSLVWFHVDFRPYQCEACEEGLRWNGNMSDQERVHESDRPDTVEVALLVPGPVPTPSPIGALRPGLAPSRLMRVSKSQVSRQDLEDPLPLLPPCLGQPRPDLAHGGFMGGRTQHSHPQLQAGLQLGPHALHQLSLALDPCPDLPRGSEGCLRAPANSPDRPSPDIATSMSMGVTASPKTRSSKTWYGERKYKKMLSVALGKGRGL